MFKVKMGVLLAAVIAVFAVSVAPAMALKNFIAKTGTGQVKGKNISAGDQIFETKFGKVECKEVNASGPILAEKATQQELEFKYPTGSCKAILELPTSITPAKYTFYINGQVKLNNEVKVETAGCKLVVPAGQKFGENQVKYKNNGNNLKGEAKVKGIEYVGKGATCESSGVKSANGTYEGIEELEGNKPPTLVNVE